jgi:adenylate cyclase
MSAGGDTRKGRRLARRTGALISFAHLLAGVVGAVYVFVLLWFVLPSPVRDPEDPATLFAVNAGTLLVYLVASGVVGTAWGWRRLGRAGSWLREGHEPDEAERVATLAVPRRTALISGAAWAGAAVVFGAVNAAFSVERAYHIAIVILLGGLTATALGYLLSERLMRPVLARALEAGPVEPQRPGVTGRSLLAWAFATGVPLLGMMILAVLVLAGRDATEDEMAVSMLAISGVAAFCGLVATVLVARSVARPLKALRRAVGRIGEGDFSAHVEVDDGSEVGLLQDGFNRMATGLEERDRLRELFGRHVGEEVAREALGGDGDGLQLGGEVREVAVLFVDLVGSTAMAADRPPREVVQTLNEFFAVVVEVVDERGGWINKFQGDAALAVFGAPAELGDPAGAALAAARTLADRLRALDDVDAGIGVSAGEAVAGNVGSEERFEYTVIGDPVNEAARLCELAKEREERVLASRAVLSMAREEEGERWADCEEITLRGRTEPTRLCAPA